MAAASDEELAAMVESWNKLREEQNKAAEDIADFRTGFSETMDAISGDLEATIDDMDLGTEAAEAGRATIQGFIEVQPECCRQCNRRIPSSDTPPSLLSAETCRTIILLLRAVA